MTWRLHIGDCREVLAGMPAESFDSCTTDPPYELTSGASKRGFMGQAWDGSGVAHDVSLWREVFRVLKPGAYLAAFGGTRTYHRMTCAIEDAGFEIRDSLSWAFGSGFPKSLNVSRAIDMHACAEDGRHFMNATPTGAKAEPGDHVCPKTPEGAAWEGYGTALKPAHEPIVLARKPLERPAIDVVSVIERELRSRFEGEIRWTRLASDAVKRSQPPPSSATRRPSMAATSVASAVGGVTPSTEAPTENGIARLAVTGTSATAKGRAKTGGKSMRGCDDRSSQRTEGGARAAGKPSPTFSPLTTSLGAELATDESCTGRSMPRSGASDSPPSSVCSVGIAIGLRGFTETVHITRLADGSFVWPTGLPERIAERECSVAANLLAHGTGAIAIDACRVGTSKAVPASPRGANQPGSPLGRGAQDGNEGGHDPNVGRWPPNVLLTHAADCRRVGERVVTNRLGGDAPGVGFSGGGGRRPKGTGHGERTSPYMATESVPTFDCAPGCPVAEIDAQSGDRPSVGARYDMGMGYGGSTADGSRGSVGYDDNGGASRFMPTFEWAPEDVAPFLYCAKPATSERDAGLDGLHVATGGEATAREDGTAGLDSPRAGAGRKGGRRNTHPTVKPIALMRWLVRLVTPKGGRVLEPFAGSGTTLLAADREGFDVEGIELSPEYAAIARRRIEEDSPLFNRRETTP
jgi:DNA modification methylase